MAVIVAVGLGILVGLLWPSVGESLKPLGTGFVNLIKMMISPIIFCTIVLGIGSVRQAAKVGKVGGLALGYFLVMSTVALTIGLVVGNLLHPGSGLDLSGGEVPDTSEAEGTVEFLLGIIPATLFSALTSSQVLQTLLVGSSRSRRWAVPASRSSAGSATSSGSCSASSPCWPSTSPASSSWSSSWACC